MKIGRILKRLLEDESGVKFVDNQRDYSHGQEYKDISMFVNGERVAYADYSVFENKVYIDIVESIVKGKGYGQMIMKHLCLSQHTYLHKKKRHGAIVKIANIVDIFLQH